VQGRRVETVAGPARRREQAGGRSWQVSGAGFWQVYPGAADVLVRAVREALQPADGETLLDLFSGVGLFAGALAGELGSAGAAVAVEADETAVRDARRNLHDVGRVRLVQARVDRYLRAPDAPFSVDLVVLDPPRSGAGRGVCTAIAARRPRVVAYVACDPAALARDVATFADLGYEMTGLRAFDLFPMTHHVECVATLRPTGLPGRMVADADLEA
jgi:tRNA/tmRNA/rRNA uracil-C5-methylase (TrmA/RlmC/RlmD family)